MTVLAVMRKLKSEVDAGNLRPYCFVDINGLKLASPDNIYRVSSYMNPIIAFIMHLLYMI